MNVDRLREEMLRAIYFKRIYAIDDLVFRARDFGFDIMKSRFRNMGIWDNSEISVLMMGIVVGATTDVVQCLLKNGADVS